jgi:hypothetical protein
MPLILLTSAQAQALLHFRGFVLVHAAAEFHNGIYVTGSTPE